MKNFHVKKSIHLRTLISDQRKEEAELLFVTSDQPTTNESSLTLSTQLHAASTARALAVPGHKSSVKLSPLNAIEQLFL